MACSVFDTTMHNDNTTSTRPAKAPTAQQFAALVGQLRRTNDELNHFVRALSHDMGANLMLLESSVSRLKRSLRGGRPAAGEDMAHVEACLRQSRRLLNDMVELGRTGSVQVEPRRVELEGVVDEVLFEQRELLAARGIKVEVQRPLPAFWCNEDRLKQIVVNLVRNAAKHGCDPHRPRITITCSDAVPMENGSDRRLAEFRVHDNGPGIPPQFREEIFLPGRRLTQADVEGSGMGLAIVRKIVELYGGAVFVDPQTAEGTVFAVRLPQPVEAQPPAPHSEARPAAGVERPAARHSSHSPQPHNRFQPGLKRPGRR
jgi:signal transduction histidine kinase